MKRPIEPTEEDRETVRKWLEDPRDHLMEILVRNEARRRIAREEEGRRRARIRRLTFGLLG